MRITLIILVALSLGSCVVYDTWDRCETMRKGEVRWQFPADEIAREIKITRESLPEKCEQYLVEYTPDQWDEVKESYPENIAWRECMGVGRK